ncbi:MAG: hypothetical protein IH623_28060 [Verrucomicrobia bacterium]|nr:hypothetical protein [Verrucomicrobiota bacterium]
MKRALLAIVILVAGTTVFCALRNATTETKREAAIRTTAWQMQTQQLAQLYFEQQQVLERVRETRQLLAAQPTRPALSVLAEKVLSGAALNDLSPAESEQLLAELGFNWNTTGDYLIVSKQSLPGISLTGIKGVKLTEAARGTLAITPEEQVAIEALAERLRTEHTAWVIAHAQREEPSGDVLARYSLPKDAEFSQSRSNAFVSGILATLGLERGELMEGPYAYSWMWDAGMLDDGVGLKADRDDSTTLTVNRYPAGTDGQLLFTIKQAGDDMTAVVAPWQPFPQAFKPLFPNGWPDLAAHEGFELPKTFREKAETR